MKGLMDVTFEQKLRTVSNEFYKNNWNFANIILIVRHIDWL